VMSYLDDLDFGIVACRDMMPDAWPLLDDMRDSLDELVKAANV
jgi:diacylglycerol O-acyltransferase / wax synthase